MKKDYVWVTCFSAAALFCMVAVVHAQQAPAQPGLAPGAPAAAAQAPQPGLPGQQLLPQAGGIETRQNIMRPGNRFGQQRGANLQGGIADPAPTAANLPSPSEQYQQQSDQSLMRPGQPNGQQGTIAGGQPGELGVWLVASGGPGVEIRRITDGSAAHQAGLRQGDVILQVNGRGATSPQEVSRMIRQIPAGEMVAIEVWSNGTTAERQVTLQPVREQYEVGFRGGEATSRASGDLASRTMRIEEQLAMVMRELQQLRQEMVQLRAAASSQPATVGGGFGEPSSEAGFDAIDQSATQSTTTQPDAAATQPAATEPTEAAAEPDPFADTTTEPAEEATTEPAAEPATEEPATEDSDPFGASSDEPATEEATPAEGETAAETEPAETETEADSDSLFE